MGADTLHKVAQPTELGAAALPILRVALTVYRIHSRPLTALSSLRAYSRIFKESGMKDMRAIFEAFDEVTLLKGLYVLSLSQGAA